MLKVSDLIEDQKKRNTIKKQVYKDLLENCYKKIQTANKKNQNHVIFKVDVIKFGMPLYDINFAIKYISAKLKKGDFAVTKLNDNTLFINWTRH